MAGDGNVTSDDEREAQHRAAAATLGTNDPMAKALIAMTEEGRRITKVAKRVASQVDAETRASAAAVESQNKGKSGGNAHGSSASKSGRSPSPAPGL